jgi:hypothetical protein
MSIVLTGAIVMKIRFVWALTTLLIMCGSTTSCLAGVNKRHAIPGKVFVGYQGWFRCPGDGSPKNTWSHWSKGDPSAGTMSVDLYPDLGELDPKSLCPVPGMTINGKQAYLFSSFPIQTVRKHFEWMRTYHIDGAFLQRFINSIPEQRLEGDTVLKNVRTSAEETGRTFLVEYDLSGAHPDTALSTLQQDWMYLSKEAGVTQSSAYLKDGRRPVVAIWGLGFGDKSHLQDPALALQIVHWFQQVAGCTVIGGVPAAWGTLTRDSATNPAWNSVYDALDIVQPWTVGRYNSLAAVDKWRQDVLVPDIERTRNHGQMYMPVIFPGFSWHNLNRGQPENQIPRLGGEFLWRQAYNAKTSGASFVKIAMFDEVNEGTAIFKATPTRKQAPEQGYWLTLDADGKTLPEDWYLRLTQSISAMFHGDVPATDQMPNH